jgi:hypothetical protein
MISTKTLLDYANQSRPFTIHLADRRAITVPHGEWLYINPKSSRFIVETDQDTEIINLTMVTSIRRAKLKHSN